MEVGAVNDLEFAIGEASDDLTVLYNQLLRVGDVNFETANRGFGEVLVICAKEAFQVVSAGFL